MNCDKCQELLSEFIDGELGDDISARVQTHLDLCLECAEIYEDFAGILGFCDESIEEVKPPNPHALWCRINNVIETEIKPEILKEAEEKKAKRNWLSRMWNRTWSLSFTQLTSAVLGVAIISSLLTIVGIKNALVPRSSSQIVSASMQPSLFDLALRKVGLSNDPQIERENRIREQEATIEYWNKRVTARRNQWDKHLQDAFDRNINEIDQVLSEYNRNLQDNPQDELTVEMIDTALHEKVELLKEFSEL